MLMILASYIMNLWNIPTYLLQSDHGGTVVLHCVHLNIECHNIKCSGDI